MNTHALHLDLHPAMITAATAMAASRDLTMGELMRDLLAREISADMSRAHEAAMEPHRPWLGTRKLGSGLAKTDAPEETSDYEVIEPF